MSSVFVVVVLLLFSFFYYYYFVVFFLEGALQGAGREFNKIKNIIINIRIALIMLKK